jgi:uncharacterized protein
MSFKHGVTNQDLQTAGGTININLSSVIAIVGVSPVGDVQTLTLCNNADDDAQFGENTPDNSIAKTLGIIRAVVAGASKSPSDGSCPVVVVNVYDDGVHKIAIGSAGVNKTPDATTGKLALAFTIIGDLDADVLITKHSDASGVNVAAGGAYVYGTDYKLDRYGNFIDITGTYKGVPLDFAGYKLSSAAVTGAHIIGGTSGSVKTGLALLDRTAGTWGFKPKILICPLYATLSGVAAAFEIAAGKFRGEWLSDAAAGTSYSAAIALRGSGQWNTAMPQTRPVWPYLKSADPWVGTLVAFPFSAFLAGMYVANDNNTGFWDSVSNQQIPTVEGVEIEINTDIEDSTSEATLLNAQGIMTYMSGFGLGYNTWGDRNASFPSGSSVKTFSNVYRTDGMLSDAMAAAALRLGVDKSIIQARIDLMKQEGNNFLNSIVQEGGLLPGSRLVYSKSDNPTSDLAAGKVKYRRIYMVPTPAESITFLNQLDISLFGTIG